MHGEWGILSAEAAERIAAAKRQGGRIIAVGFGWQRRQNFTAWNIQEGPGTKAKPGDIRKVVSERAEVLWAVTPKIGPD